jgi:hypothetical protein
MRRSAGVAATLALCAAAWAASTPAAAISCQNGYQRVQGQLLATPYCQDQYLAQIARGRGFKTSAAAIRNNPQHKKEVCRYMFSDIRVQQTCLDAGVPEFFGGAGR